MALSRVVGAIRTKMLGTPAALPLAEAYWWFADRRPQQRADSTATGRPERRFADSLRRWMTDLYAAEPPRPLPPARRVLVFTFVQRWVEICAAISFVLAHRNCTVDLAFVPQYWNRQAGPARGWDRVIHERLIWRPLSVIRHPRLRAFSLDQVRPDAVPPDLALELAEQARIDVMYIRRKESIETSGGDAPIYAARLERNTKVAGQLAALLRTGAYDAALIGNGLVLDGGAAYRTVSASSVLPVTFEGWPDPGSIVASQGKPWSWLDVSREWAADEPHELTGERERRMRSLMRDRERPRSTGIGYSYQARDAEEPDAIRRRLGIDPSKCVVLLCTNVFWDSVFLVMTDHPFRSMRDWLLGTVGHLAARDDVHVIVQAHPLERFGVGAAETAASILADAGLDRAANVRILSPRAANTYSLIRIADVGSVYASTTGLEMALSGVPVICGNRYHYAGKGFTCEPETTLDFFALLDRAVQDPGSLRLTRRQTELAWCYADVFFHQLPKSFPWTLTSFRNDEVLDMEQPLANVLAPEGQRRYGAIFDLLAGR